MHSVVHICVWVCKIESVHTKFGGANDGLGKCDRVKRTPLAREKKDVLIGVEGVLYQTIMKMGKGRDSGVDGAEFFVFICDSFREASVAHLTRASDLVEISEVKGRDKRILRDPNPKKKVENRTVFEVVKELNRKDVLKGEGHGDRGVERQLAVTQEN